MDPPARASAASATHVLSGSAGLGVRAGKARFDISYALVAYDANGSFALRSWGTAQLSAYLVFGECFTLNAWGRALQGGGEGGVDLGYYATRDLGFFAGGFGGIGELYSQNLQVDRYGGDVGFSYWATPRFRLAAYYQLTKNHLPEQVLDGLTYGYDETEHAVSFAVALRVP